MEVDHHIVKLRAVRLNHAPVVARSRDANSRLPIPRVTRQQAATSGEGNLHQERGDQCDGGRRAEL